MKKEKVNKKESIFKSKPFIAKVDQIDYKFNCKYLFLIVMISFLSMTTALLAGFGYEYIMKLEYKDTLKAISIFTGAWTILFFIWWIIQTIFYIRLNTNKSKWLEIFSFLPIFNIVSIVRLSLRITTSEFNAWLRGAFSNDKFENNPNDYLTKKWWLNFLCLFLMTPVIGFLWLREPDLELTVQQRNFWFEGYHYFTIQTNLLCWTYMLVSLVLPRHKIHNNDSVLICLITYIFVVSVTYNAGLLPISKTKYGWSNFQWAKTCWEHMINPIVFIAIGIYNMYWTCTKQNTIRDYGTVLKFGMIIPTIYLTYALFLPFVTNISVYGIVTNCNPNLPNKGFEDAGFFSHGSPAMLVCILGYLLVFVAVITMVWRIKYAFYAKVKKQTTTTINVTENVNIETIVA